MTSAVPVQGGQRQPTDTFRASLWFALSPPAPATLLLQGSQHADVAIIGGGILGLSMALHLAERGVSTALLEAEEFGFGASGRNTGFVVPSFIGGLGPREVSNLIGAEAGETLSRFVGGSGAELFKLIERLGIDCAAEANGWLQPAHTDAKVRMLEERVRQWQALRQPVELLDRDKAQALTGSPIYRGALIDRSGGQINPLAYARGLAGAASAAGARLYANARVHSHRIEAGKWLIETRDGSVLAEKVFFASNAMGGALLPDVSRSLIAVQPYQVVTQPLDEAVRARILPQRQPVADLHNHTFAVRWSPDNRLMTGGLGVINSDANVKTMAESFLARLHKYLPGLPPLQATYAWRGVAATTENFLPAVWSVGRNLYAPIGCNGRGVAVATSLGRALAAFAASGDARDLPVAVTAPQPRPFHSILSTGPSLWLLWNQCKDWRDDSAGS